MNLSYQEKSIWGSLLVMVGATLYFASEIAAIYATGAAPTFRELAPLTLSLVILIVGAEAGYHVTLSLCAKNTPKDERDRLVDAKSARNAYYTLIVALAVIGGHVAIGELLAVGKPPSAGALYISLLASLAIAEIGHYASQLVYYRRGV